METEQKNQKLTEYSALHQSWTSELVSSLSFTIQIFATIELGIIGFLLSSDLNKKTVPIAIKCGPPDYFTIFFYLCILFCLLSVFFALFAIINRVNEFRFHRNVFLVRKKLLEEKGELLPEHPPDIKPHWGDRFFFLKLLVSPAKQYFIITDKITKETDSVKLNVDFTILVNKTRIFSRYTWINLNCQLIFLLLSSICFATTLFISAIDK